MDNLAEKESITIGPPARCARHDITLPCHIKTIVITLGNMYQPSYLTKIQIWLVSRYLRLRMPEKKGATQIVEVTLYDSRELNHGSDYRNKSSPLNQGEVRR